MEFHDLIPPIFEINELFAKKNQMKAGAPFEKLKKPINGIFAYWL